MRIFLNLICLTLIIAAFGQPSFAKGVGHWPFLDAAQRACFQFAIGKIESLDKLVSLGAEKKEISRKKVRYRKDVRAVFGASGVTVTSRKYKKFNKCEIHTAAKLVDAQVLWQYLQKSLESQGYTLSRQSSSIYHLTNGKTGYFLRALHEGGTFFLDIRPLGK